MNHKVVMPFISSFHIPGKFSKDAAVQVLLNKMEGTTDKKVKG